MAGGEGRQPVSLSIGLGQIVRKCEVKCKSGVSLCMQVMHRYQKQLAGGPTVASKRAQRAAMEALQQDRTTAAPSSPPPAATRRRRTKKQ